MESKYIAGFLFIALGIAVYFTGTNLINSGGTCTGFNAINPLCWSGITMDILSDTISIIVASIIVFFGILVIALPQDRLIWILLTGVFLVLTIVLIFDPLPVVDEAASGIATLIFGAKAFTPKETQKQIGVF